VSETPGLVGRVVAPLVNTNEPDAQVIDLQVTPFSEVAVGDHLCTLETSKATVEVESEYAGFVGPVSIALDDIITAGDLICEIFDAMPDRDAGGAAAPASEGGGPRMTKKAQSLARELGVDPSLLPTDRFVTEKDVRLAAQAAAPAELPADLAARIHENALVVFGGGGLGKTLIDLVRAGDRYEVVGVVDDGLEPGTEVLGVPVVGGQRYLAPLAEAGLLWATNAVGAIGRISTRTTVSERIAEAGLRAPALVDPSASIAASATLDDGVQVFAQAIVSAAARVGANTIVNSGAIVSHDCTIGANSHIAPGAVLAGEVVVGEGALVGMGVTASVGLRIGDRCVIGNGSVVTADVPDGTVVSAGTVWPGERAG
jgi:acetyltransferase EpsM